MRGLMFTGSCEWAVHLEAVDYRMCADRESDRYFEGGISSVYFWDIDDGFAGCVLLKKCTFLPLLFAISD
jgi:hypothetical protein